MSAQHPRRPVAIRASVPARVTRHGLARTISVLVAVVAVGLILAPAALGQDRIYFGNYNPQNEISWANLDGSGGGDLSTPGATVFYPLGTAIDAAAGDIYWVGFEPSNTVSEASLDGTGGSDLEIDGTDVDAPSGMAIDPVAGKIYWANAGNNTISVANLDGSEATNLDTTGATVAVPAAVAIDPAANRIYWSNFNQNNNTIDDRISYANLDGTGNGGDLDTGAATVADPIGVAIDRTTGKIYWGNSNSGGPISWASLDGTDSGDLNISGAANPQMPEEIGRAHV